MRYVVTVALAAAGLLFSSLSFANTYTNCTVENVSTHEQLPNLVVATLSCNAPDAATSGASCAAGIIRPNAFVFDTSTTTGKAHMSLVLMAMATEKRIWASTYGACPTTLNDTLVLYALKVFKQ
jgi:hypothetical protein